jgi:environmental stress-induced protein Ves
MGIGRHEIPGGMAKESLHRVMEPARRQAFPFADPSRRTAELAGGDEQSVNILRRLAGVKDQAHNVATCEKQFASDAIARKFFVQCLQELAYAPSRQHQTRSPRLESINMLRRRNGGGEAVSKCARNAREESMKTGAGRGSTPAVHKGGTMPARWAASSTIAVT